jgi:CarD family transcriptional regulator
MQLAEGDLVVYGTHGIGRVAARMSSVVSGATREVVVLDLADGLTVTLPLERAQEQLRPLANEADVRKVKETLRAEAVLSEEPWLKRQRDTQAKLASGNPIELAEVVRDGAWRERALGAKGKSQLSGSEKQTFIRARQLLADEIALAQGIPAPDAEAWIDEQLARTR